MQSVVKLIFRYLTDADFFNLYKPAKTESGGGGQTYIDFSLKDIPAKYWYSFFRNVNGTIQSQARNGPRWDSCIKSIGLSDLGEQSFAMYQRRGTSIVISSQHINTQGANRIWSWLPDNGFPSPVDPTVRSQCPYGLAVYIVKTDSNELWAGWFLNGGYNPLPCKDKAAASLLKEFLSRRNKQGKNGIVSLRKGKLFLDTSDNQTPFQAASTSASASNTQRRTEIQTIDEFFDEDYKDRQSGPAIKKLVTIKKRNLKAVKRLKQLYDYSCQLTGDSHVFIMSTGKKYVEAHHLVPLGEGGADDPRNIVIVNPLIHRMLHYAIVSGVDLAQIKTSPDGSAKLDIEINGSPYSITWKEQHAKHVTNAKKR